MILLIPPDMCIHTHTHTHAAYQCMYPKFSCIEDQGYWRCRIIQQQHQRKYSAKQLTHSINHYNSIIFHSSFSLISYLAILFSYTWHSLHFYHFTLTLTKMLLLEVLTINISLTPPSPILFSFHNLTAETLRV